MSAEIHQNKYGAKKRKLEDVHHKLLSSGENCTTSNDHGFVKFCTNSSLKTFDDEYLQTFNDSTTSGKYFNILFNCDLCNSTNISSYILVITFVRLQIKNNCLINTV